MNMLRDLKGRFRATYEQLTILCRWIWKRLYDENKLTVTSPELFTTAAITSVNAPNVGDVVDNIGGPELYNDATEEAAQDIKRLLAILHKEFDIPARKALRDTGVDTDLVERLIANINHGAPFRVSVGIASMLAERLDTEREIARAEKKKRREERALRAAVEASPAASPTPPPTAVDQHAEAVAKLRAALDEDYGRAEDMLQKALTFVSQRRGNLDKLPYPAPPSNDAEKYQKQLVEAEAQATALAAKAATADAERAQLQQEIAEMKLLLDDPASTDPFRLRYAALVDTLKPLLFGSGDLSAMLGNLEAAKKVVSGADADLRRLPVKPPEA